MLNTLNVAWYACVIAEGVLLGRLLFLRLRLPWFKTYLAASILQSAFMLIVAPRPSVRAYEAVWIGSESFLMVLASSAGVEASLRLGESFPGIGRFGYRAIIVCSVVAACLCALSIVPGLHGVDWHRPVLTWAITAKRVVSTIISLTLLAVLLLVSALPARVPRNVLAHMWLLSAYLAIPAIGFFALAWHLPAPRAISIAMLAAAALCFALWSVVLRRRGEARPAPSRVVTNSDVAASGLRLRRLAEIVESALSNESELPPPPDEDWPDNQR